MGKRLLIFFVLFLAAVLVSSGIFLLFYKLDQKTPNLTIEPMAAPSQIATIDYQQWQKQHKEDIVLAKEEVNQKITLFAAGDVMMARAVERRMLALDDFSYCMAPMKKIIESADVAFANLESPIISGPNTPDDSVVFRAHPKSVESLKLAGFDIVSVANNHFGNQGQQGMLSTFDFLTSQFIDYVGAGRNLEAMHNPLIKQVKDLNIAFLAYSYAPISDQATEKQAGLAIMDIEQLRNDIEVAKKQKSDIIIVSMHDGIEYANEPSEHQKEFAHAAIDSGADLVIGHHPHVVQQMEIYQDKYIFYSLGNFVFDQMWSRDTQLGLGVMFTIEKDGIKDLKYYPVQIKDYCQPNFADDKTAEEVLEKL